MSIRAFYSLWVVLALVGLWLRVPLPVDETRYLSVAWEMWRHDSFLVPLFNGEPYSHKPPFLFWLMHAGWKLFGVNELWPRLITPLSSLLAMVLTGLIARRLWPEDRCIGRNAILILGSSALWLSIFTLIQFDMLLTCCVLLAMLGVLDAVSGQGRGWVVAGIAMGLGVLVKGPVVFVHVLPVMLLASWWRPALPASPASTGVWLGGLISILLAVVIAFAWAGPAAMAGGDAYREAIFWGQYAGRVGPETLIHRAPVWFYLVWLPVAALPWILSTTSWTSMRLALADTRDNGTRFCLAWFVPVLLIFSLMGSKHIKYLLPAFPALALLIAVGLQRLGPVRRHRPVGLALLLVLAGVILAAVPLVASHRLPVWTLSISPLWGVVMVISGLALLRIHIRDAGLWLRLHVGVAVALFAIIHLAIAPAARPAYDVRPVAQRIAAFQADDIPVLNAARYHDQYAFAGRLEKPLDSAVRPDEIQAWARRYPDGRVILYYKHTQEPPTGAGFSQPYRGGWVSIRKSAELLSMPDLLPVPAPGKRPLI